MILRILLILILVPLVELTLLMMLADWSSWRTALTAVVASGLAGLLLMHHQGLRTVSRIRAELATSQMPRDALLDGLLIFFAGLLLLVPGLLTDIGAVLLLIPTTRGFAKAYFVRRFRARFTTQTTIVEGTFVREAGDDRWTEQRLK